MGIINKEKTPEKIYSVIILEKIMIILIYKIIIIQSEFSYPLLYIIKFLDNVWKKVLFDTIDFSMLIQIVYVEIGWPKVSSNLNYLTIFKSRL